MIQFRQLFVLLTVIMALVSCDKPQTQKKDVIIEAIPVVTIAPAYPRQAALDKIEGKVSIQFTVSVEGTVMDPKIVSPPSKIFDREALRAIIKYKFIPKRINNVPVESLVIQMIDFKLSK